MLHHRMKHRRRYQEIINTFVSHGFSHILFRIGLTDRVKKRATKDAYMEDNITDIGKRLREAFQSLGPTFIKLGQIASARRDLVPEAIAIELEKLQDDVQSFPYEQVNSIIEREFGTPIEEVFESFSERPLATASIGQVHTATLPSGEEVAVKIQRPDIEEIIHTDLDILQNIVILLENRVEWVRNYRIRDMIDEFSHSLKNELDYILEGRNADRLRDLFVDDPVIHIPTIHWEYTTRYVLTMEKIDGIKVSKCETLKEQGYDTEELASHIADAMLYQILEAGFFHGDPHPGNIFVLPENRVAFLDFGMVGHLSEDLRYHFSSLLIHLRAGDTEGMIRTFDDWGLLDRVPSLNELRRDIDSMLVKYYEVPLKQISLGAVMLEIFNLSYKHRIDIPNDIAVLGKTILTLESVLENLDPEFSIMDAVEPYGEKLFYQRYHPFRFGKRTMRSMVENMKILSELPRDIKDLASAMKRGKLQFDINVFESRYILNKLDRITNRISFSIILLAFSILMAGLIIGASLVGKVPLIWSIPVIEIGFIIATLLFIFMVYIIFRSGRM